MTLNLNFSENSYRKANPTLFARLVEYVQHKTYSDKIAGDKELMTWLDDVLPELRDPKYTIATKCYWVLHDLHEKTYCANPSCRNEIPNVFRLSYGYAKRCSVACMNRDPEHITTNKDKHDQHLKEDPEWNAKRKRKHDKTMAEHGLPTNWTNPDKCAATKAANHDGDWKYNNTEKAQKTRRENRDGDYCTEEERKNLSKKTSSYRSSALCAIRTEIGMYKRASEKAYAKRKANGTLSASKAEDTFYDMLCTCFGSADVIRQYKSELYPFYCDFYIKSQDLYIECNFHWTHGGHTFDEKSPDDIAKLEFWRSKIKPDVKRKSFYEQAIYVWTDLDPRKMKTAHDNCLNYLVFWTLDEAQSWCESLDT